MAFTLNPNTSLNTLGSTSALIGNSLNGLNNLNAGLGLGINSLALNNTGLGTLGGGLGGGSGGFGFGSGLGFNNSFGTFGFNNFGLGSNGGNGFDILNGFTLCRRCTVQCPPGTSCNNGVCRSNFLRGYIPNPNSLQLYRSNYHESHYDRKHHSCHHGHHGRKHH